MSYKYYKWSYFCRNIFYYLLDTVSTACNAKGPFISRFSRDGEFSRLGSKLMPLDGNERDRGEKKRKNVIKINGWTGLSVIECLCVG